MATPRMTGRPWRRLRKRVLSEAPLCPLCEAEGRTVAAVEVDHITPLHDGGSNDRANLQGLCVDHHAEKTLRERGGAKGVLLDGTPRSRLAG